MLTAKFNPRLTFTFLAPLGGESLLFLASVFVDKRSVVNLIALFSCLVILKISPLYLLFLNVSVTVLLFIYLIRYLKCTYILMTHVCNLGKM